VQDVLNDPHFKQRQIFCDGVHPHAGPFTYVGQPGIVEGQPFEVRYPAPLLGEHTDQVLREIGSTDAELDRWRTLGVI
jgi:formyl-CoA transferase